MKFIELFAGIGGFRLGLETVGRDKDNSGFGTSEQPKEKGLRPNGAESLPMRRDGNRGRFSSFCCVWANEIDKYACQIYRKNFGEGELYEGDITKVKADDIPDHDLLCAGFPCQAFSIAGQRRGFQDTRGTLFFEIARIVEEKQPRYLLLENVKGLLSHNEGTTFAVILNTLDELGYDLQWQVLNSKNFGVPQNRERVFIVGHLRGTGRPQVFPIGETNTEYIESMGWQRQPLRFLDRNQKNINGDYFYALDGSQTSGIRKDTKVRRLTPTECERLQGFPDGWTGGLSDTQRYKCLGNAVTVNVIQAIAKYNQENKKDFFYTASRARARYPIQFSRHVKGIATALSKANLLKGEGG